jgi:hypothetical protein
VVVRDAGQEKLATQKEEELKKYYDLYVAKVYQP